MYIKEGVNENIDFLPIFLYLLNEIYSEDQNKFGMREISCPQEPMILDTTKKLMNNIIFKKNPKSCMNSKTQHLYLTDVY